MREMVVKIMSLHLVSGPQRAALHSNGELLYVLIKTMPPIIPINNPHIKGTKPGPGLDGAPGPIRIDSRHIAIAKPMEKRELIRSYFIIGYP
jgi:hypothetical protein